jgi:hypothetical protein
VVTLRQRMERPMPTDAYRDWIAAHPDLDALDDGQKDYEAALAMGWRPPQGGILWWLPTADAARAVKLAQVISAATGRCVSLTICPGHEAIAEVTGLAEESGDAAAALTTACLAARRAMMERDDDD